MDIEIDVIVLDDSSSMRKANGLGVRDLGHASRHQLTTSRDPVAQSKFDVAKETAIRLMSQQKMEEQTQVLFVTCLNHSNVLSNQGSSYANIKQAIEGLHASGTTPLYETTEKAAVIALQAAKRISTAREKQTVRVTLYVLTDGEADNSQFASNCRKAIGHLREEFPNTEVEFHSSAASGKSTAEAMGIPDEDFYTILSDDTTGFIAAGERMLHRRH